MPTIRKLIILLSDIVILYVSLALTLILRYGFQKLPETLPVHLMPFSFIFIVWLLIFYLSDFYQEKSLKTTYSFAQKFSLIIIICIAVSFILFYLFDLFFKLTPKTNLFIFAVVFGILDFFWRFLLAKISILSGWKRRLLIIGDSLIVEEINGYLKAHPQIGYEIVGQKKDATNIEEIKRLINESKIDTVIIQPQLKKNPDAIKVMYQLLALKITVVDLITFYETIFQKLPLEDLDESWFIEKINSRRPFYETIKKVLDFLLSLVLILLLSPFMLIIAFFIKITSKGPAIYKQQRVGLNNKLFFLYKFRTMLCNHSGPLWTTQNDSRLTVVGKFLRNTHLDEIPQLYNVLKGNIAFIGPRAERKELVDLYSQLPYYDLRHIIKPGLTGWAQVNYKPSASIEEANEKLKFDIYYIKNRSLPLDFVILIKTIKYLFFSLK